MSFSEAVRSLYFSELLQPWVEPRMNQEDKNKEVVMPHPFPMKPWFYANDIGWHKADYCLQQV